MTNAPGAWAPSLLPSSGHSVHTACVDPERYVRELDPTAGRDTTGNSPARGITEAPVLVLDGISLGGCHRHGQLVPGTPAMARATGIAIQVDASVRDHQGAVYDPDPRAVNGPMRQPSGRATAAKDVATTTSESPHVISTVRMP